MITPKQADVLAHTASNGRYVTGDADVLAMADAGLLLDYGPQVLAGGDHYLTLTIHGLDALNEWRAAQPKPFRPKRRRQTPAFEGWLAYCESFKRIPFGQFVKNVWPRRSEYR